MYKDYFSMSSRRDTRLRSDVSEWLGSPPTNSVTTQSNSSFLKGLLITVLSLFAFSTNAQVSGYSFAQTSGTYTEITGGTLLGSTADDDQYFVTTATPLGGSATSGIGFPIGFDFTYNGAVYDRLGVNSNGWIALGQSALSPAVNMNSTSAYTALASTATVTPSVLRARISGMNADYISQTGSSLRIETIGTAPNRTCVVQFKNYRRFGSAGTGQSINFQIRLNETSNTVQVMFGTNTFNTTLSVAQVGLGGSSSADFNSRTTTTNWNATTAATITTTSTSTNNAGNLPIRTTGVTAPASGLTFTWTAPNCFAPSGLAVTDITATTADIAWVAPGSGSPASYEYEIRSSGAAGSGATGLAATGTTTAPTVSVDNVGGLAASTAYNLFVRTVCASGAGTSAWTSAQAFTTLALCNRPTGITVTDITGTTADIAWVAPTFGSTASYEYEIRSSGAAGSGATGLAASGTTTAPVVSVDNVAGLSPATAYNLFIRTVCSGGDGTSLWTVAVPFTTTLNCATAIPLTAGVSVTSGNLGTTGGAYNISSCGFSTPGKELLYTFTASATGTYTLEITSVNGGSEYIEYFFKDSALGCGPTGWTCIDDNNAVGTDTFTLNAGVTYFILLDAESSSTLGNHTFRIIAPVLCDGTTTAGTVTPAASTLCPLGTVTLTPTGITPSSVSGLTYQWETSADGSTGWTNAPGTSTNATYVATVTSVIAYYRLALTCSFTTSTVNSTVASVAPATTPTVQITNLVATTATNTSITLSWTNGSGNNRSVFVNAANTFVDPIDGTVPGTASTVYGGSGQQLVYNGTASTVTVTGLTVGTTYYFRAYESLLCTSPNYLYNVTGASVALNTADRLKYTIARADGVSYSPVSGSAITLTSGTGVQDDTNFGVVSFFPFSYAGTTVSQFRATTNGFMTLNAGNSNSTFGNGIAAAAGNNFVLAPFWEDLYVNNNTPNTQFVKYEITGTVGSRVLTVQWENLELFNYPGPSLNFQVKLYEGTNVIEYVYGVMQGFDGSNPNNAAVTNGLAFNYTVGMSAAAWASPAAAGEIIGLQEANSLSFTSVGGVTPNEGLNKLSVLPNCNSSYTFSPSASIRANDAAPAIPAAPSNDEPAGAVVLTALPSVPANFCGTFYSSAFATASAGVPAEIPSTIADDDVWFKFTAISTNTTITLRGSGGYNAAMQLLSADASTVLASKNANGLTGVSLTETINAADFATVIGDTYLVRVYHAGGGTQATATATVSGGVITGFTGLTGGTGYTTSNGGAGVTATPKVYITDATGSGAVAAVTIASGVVTGITLQGSQGGTGYTAPVVTISPPNFGVTGDFSIIVNATPEAPANDNICTATSLTIGTTCTTTAGNTSTASPSPQAGCAGNPDDDVWYSFVAAVPNPVITATGLAAGFDARVQVFSSSDNTCTGTLTSLYCQSTTAGGVAEVVNTSGLTVGNTYFVRVYHNGTGSGSGSFTICVTGNAPACLTTPTAPAIAASVCEGTPTVLSWAAASGATSYDVFVDSVLVSDDQTALTFTTAVLAAGAHTWSVVPSNALGSASGCTNWTFTTIAPPTAGTISGPTALFTGNLGTYTQTGGAGFTSLQWKVGIVSGGPYTNITGATTSSEELSPNTSGTLYLVLAYINGACEVLSSELAIVVSTQYDTPCAAAVLAVGANGPYSNAGLTGDVGEVVPVGTNCDSQTTWCNATGTVNSLWATFTPTVSATYSFETPDFDTQLAVYSATDCDDYSTFTLLAANDDGGTGVFGSSLIESICLTAGTTYYVLLDGYNATTGSTELIVSQSGGGSNIAGAVATAASPSICETQGTTLSVTGGTIVPGDVWTWYEGSCGGTPAGTGASISVSPGVVGVYTYYARLEGFCVPTACVQVTLTVTEPGLLYLDADGDGYGDPTDSITGCVGDPSTEGYIANNTDCDDTLASVNPGATEVPYDGIDNDCVGGLDNGFAPFTSTMLNCGTTLSNIGSVISCVGTANAAEYQFEVRRVVNGVPLTDEEETPQTINRNVQYFSLTQLANYQYATTYSVRVMLRRTGQTNFVGYSSAPCLYSTPAVTTPVGGVGSTQLQSYCGETLPTLATLIATTSLPGVTQYRFRVTNTETGAVQTLDRSLHWFSLTMLNEFHYGTTYLVDVAVRTTAPFPTNPTFGAPCTVT
ncbi:MopE-related protein, partial [Flavobacterium dankookense]